MRTSVYWEPAPGRPATRGFTLVELLALIAILLVLVALLLPAISSAIHRARMAICKSNLRQLAATHVLYAADFDGENPPNVKAPGIWWTTSIRPYYNDNRIVFCPETTVTNKPVLGKLHVGGRSSPWFDGVQWPSSPLDEASYGQNMWVCKYAGAMTLWSQPPALHFGGVVGAIDRPGKVPMIADCNWVGGYPKDIDVPQLVEANGNASWWDELNRFTLKRHLEFSCVAFADGHAESVKLPDLWMLRWNKSDARTVPVVIPWL